MARDMYGNDANFNGYLPYRPDGALMPPQNDSNFYITGVTAGTGTQFILTSNIPSQDTTFYGYNFTRWSLRVTFNPNLSYNGNLTLTNNGTYVIAQTLEVLADSGYNNPNYTYRTFTVNIGYTEGNSNATATPPILPTTLNNATPPPGNPTGYYLTQLPGQYLVAAAGGTLTGAWQFVLDGRWLHAFNGPGMTTNAVYANFRYNGTLQGLPTSIGNPNLVGMDEDYDAVDLENWFLAMQSADGSVMIPSFHRPAAIRIDPNNPTTPIYDWGGPQNATWENAAPAHWADSASRILRPRAADGHDAATFPDLVPGPNGQITYDVDNDGDGQTDSIWVDLGYPARRNAQGQLYKPLFAFMVIGLNGRIPLNTAGNLAGGGAGSGGYHAAHLGNSVSEIDPTYALQNGFVYATDAAGAFSPQIYNEPRTATNTQVDNSGTSYPPALDVRTIQLRNLLAGTRPQQNPLQPGSYQINGDNNFVLVNGTAYFMPNSIADIGDIDMNGTSPPVAGVIRLTPPVAGRWGEAQSVPGSPAIDPATGLPINLVGPTYTNRIRAGYSIDISDLRNGGIPRDAADDNYNSFDPYPPISATYNRLGEVNDLDFLDLAGAFLLPVERLRRYVTPGDINGTGRIRQWNAFPTWTKGAGPDAGGDQWGRVEYYSYFRPPGLPGVVAPTPPGSSGPLTTPVAFPWTNTEPYPTTMVTNNPAPPNPPSNSNPLHGLESQRFPNLNYPSTGTSWNPQHAGGVPIDQNPMAAPLTYLPAELPTYDASVNGNPKVNSDGLNEADEMNLYVLNAQLDTPFGYGDLEWLYRQQDVDGGSLTSRLAQLAPISFSNPVDGQRRRRLFALDSWEMNNFAWTNDNPPPAPPATIAPFAYNSRFTQNADAGFTTLNVPASTNPNILPPISTPALPNPTYPPYYPFPAPAPSLAQRDKKINLNYPLPVSNDCNEPVRQKWISDTYQTLKAILPPRAVDTAEELAQLSQFVINIIDFRDTDATMTHWTNPDVFLHLGTATTSPYLIMETTAGTGDVPLDQYGMEYNPIAINEVLAYSFQSSGTPATINRFYIELVNVLTSPELGTPTAAGLGTPTNNASVLDLAGFQSNITPPQTPWDGGCWDLVFTDDLPINRPDPVVGQLQPGTSCYGLIPLVQPSFQPPNSPPVPAGDPVIFPLPQAPPQGAGSGANYFIGDSNLTPVASYYFLTIGDQPPPSTVESAPYQPTYILNPQWDPVSSPQPPAPPAGPTVPPGVLPPPTYNGTSPSAYPNKLLSGNGPGPGTGYGAMCWACLRRPANPFAPVTQKNPMVVVDAMRFPFIEGGGNPGNPPTQGPNCIFSYQRLQPFRGGHAVPQGTSTTLLDPRYGYTEQIAVPTTYTADQGLYGTGPITGPKPGAGVTAQPYIYHTLGSPNDGTLYPGSTTPPNSPYLNEPWDYFPFNDRDFTSVAELLMVPGCPPGLFTKQFAEFAPSSTNVTSIFGMVKPLPSPSPVLPPQFQNLPTAPATASSPFSVLGPTSYQLIPHTFPYLVDKFFYTGATPNSATTSLFGDPTGDGWFKMFEFFEVPSQMIGAVGPVAQGTNFDWLRQDTKPGLINLNLIIDEEVFFSVFGSQNSSFSQQLLSFDQLPSMLFFSGITQPWTAATTPIPLVAGTSPIPLVVTASLASGAPAAAYAMNNVGVLAIDRLSNGALGNRMKASFAQFLSLRHGGSGFVFGYGSGTTGQNTAVQMGNTKAPAAPNNPIPADRPFHSLSYPDINYTIMRPAALPPSAYTDPPINQPATPLQWPPGYAGNYTADPGVRNPSLYQGFLTAASAAPAGSVPQSTPSATGGTTPFLLPPAIPVRRLFQPPDVTPITATPVVMNNASEQGDQYINNLSPNQTPPATVATGGLPPFQVPPLPSTGITYSVNDQVVNLFWVQGGTTPPQPPTTPAVPNPYLGWNWLPPFVGTTGASAIPPQPPQLDTKQHPYFRTEMLQKAMNLTTVRTHQYAVWITVGFFEVKRQGDLGMASGTPLLAYDLLGPEIGASTGETTRFRSFFLVDRLQLTGYDPNVVGSFRPAVVYRQTIE